MNDKQTLQEYLQDVGLRAEVNIPPADDYSYCCGFFINKNAPAYQARILVLTLIIWLRELADETADNNILSAALYLADKFI